MSGGRVDHHETAEGCLVEPAIAGQQSIGLLHGVRTDQEVWDQAIATAATEPV